MPSLKVRAESFQPIEVWLITDSIMRHISEEKMVFRKYRVNFTRIDRTGSRSLLSDTLLENIEKKKPDILYLHLGINDIQSGVQIPDIVDNFKKFDERLQRISPATRVVISFPLLNGKDEHSHQVFTLRHSLSQLAGSQEHNDNPSQKIIFLQKNDKFFEDTSSTRRQNTIYYLENDRLHLSSRGKTAITCTMRDTVDLIIKTVTPLL
jgi:lysophospholipase L1-like esterase